MQDELLKKLLAKKKPEKMSPEYKSAKMGMLKELMGEMEKGMAEPLRGLKKVTVASDSPEGLKKGLEKAEDVIEQQPEMSEEMDASPEMEEEASESEDEMEGMSKEQIDEMIRKLELMKAKC